MTRDDRVLQLLSSDATGPVIRKTLKKEGFAGIGNDDLSALRKRYKSGRRATIIAKKVAAPNTAKLVTNGMANAKPATNAKQPGSDTLKVSVETVTPKMAEAWLATSKINRRIAESSVLEYAIAMERGEWRHDRRVESFSHEAVTPFANEPTSNENADRDCLLEAHAKGKSDVHQGSEAGEVADGGLHSTRRKRPYRGEKSSRAVAKRLTARACSF